MRFRRQFISGMTVLEVVIVIAVCTLLAAIAIPIGAKTIENARIARATQECQTIATAVESFVRDVNRWPTMGSSGSYGVACTLVSGTSVNASDTHGFAQSTSKTQKWVRAGSGTDTTKTDTIDNHLVTNTPFGQGTNIYPTSGQYAWKGPYLESVHNDPWGHPYLIVLQDFCSGGIRLIEIGVSDTTFSRVVACAGPNGIIDSAYQPTGTSGITDSLPTGDDIWIRLDTE